MGSLALIRINVEVVDFVMVIRLSGCSTRSRTVPLLCLNLRPNSCLGPGAARRLDLLLQICHVILATPD